MGFFEKIFGKTEYKCDNCGAVLSDGRDFWCKPCEELEDLGDYNEKNEDTKSFAELIKDSGRLLRSLENNEISVEKYILLRDKILAKKKTIPSAVDKMFDKYGVV